MREIFGLYAVLCFTVTKLFVFGQSRQSFQVKDLSGTNMRYNTNYFIKLSANNNYLRWDGNINGDVNGLTYVKQTNLHESTDESLIRSYIFVIERDVNSMIKIRNIFTNRYISYYSSDLGFVLSNNSAYDNSLRLVVHPTTNLLSLASANAASTSYLYSSYAFRSNLWINSITSSESSAALQFVDAPNITQTSPPDIGDTDLTYGQNYFIKWSKNNYLRWDVNTNGDNGGLIYVIQKNITNITDEADRESFQFVIEPDVNHMIKLRNVRTNRYLCYDNVNVYGFLLSTNNSCNNSFRVLINPGENSISIANPSSTNYYYISKAHAFNSAFYLYYIQSTEYREYFQFIRSTQSQPTTTTITTTPSITQNTTVITTITTPIILTHDPCLPSNYALRAVVSSYQYEMLDQEVIDESTETLILIPRTVLNNTTPGRITEKIIYNENLEEIYKWFYSSLPQLNIKIEQNGVTFPPIVRRIIAFKNSRQNIISSQNSNKNIEIVYNREINIERTIEIKPQTSIDYKVYAQYTKGLEFIFAASAELNGYDTSKRELTGNELSEMVQTCANLTVLDIKENSILIIVSGSLMADLIAGLFFEPNSESNRNTCSEPDFSQK